MPGGLDDSRWAPKNQHNRINKHRGRLGQNARSSSSNATMSASHSETLLLQFEDRPLPEQEFSRFLKIVARLNWKLPFLKMGYSMAKEVTDKEQSQIQACETQFKLDFHEFYMLIERALVRLMGIFGVIVRRNGIIIDGVIRMNNAKDESSDQNTVEDSKERPIQHFYHKNVLTALQDPKNPLYSIFGKPEVRTQLSRAKDLRNRWKNIDEADPINFAPLSLSSYNLEVIMQTILTAIEEAHIVAVEYLRKRGNKPIEAKEDDWEFMVDAMDWEAV
ncbi:uncharacterized protein GGS22DRAFT_165013 [Annulohypoxylon maeteangense]|uniref:uncharacterized protein n=1 Tax=Annulohypoxylon maeteangense TaxID=1927788 RepID=UPI0020088008|nr:uncharacterized protein GGS22DRAFT_165013 [Annulohypoxylon maeteangense]KAI0884166.1 hypothetical protein GGS22DRAFT_165013 [Annulohypoxylon maeteangense]